MLQGRRLRRAKELRLSRLQILAAAPDGLAPSESHPLAALRGLVTLAWAQERADGRFVATAAGLAALGANSKGKPKP